MGIKVAQLEYVDIRPGGLRQVQRALASGKLVEVAHGPNDVASKLREISDEFHLHYDPYELLWVVMQRRHMPDGSVQENLVTTAQDDDCDDRLVQRVRQITSSGYNLADELDRIEREADAKRDYERREQLGDAADRLTFALSRDLGRHETNHTPKSRAFIPKAFKPEG